MRIKMMDQNTKEGPPTTGASYTILLAVAEFAPRIRPDLNSLSAFGRCFTSRKLFTSHKISPVAGSRNKPTTSKLLINSALFRVYGFLCAKSEVVGGPSFVFLTME